MKTKGGWQSKVTTWAGWLLGGGLLLVLAVGAMTLSTDGARLKRLFAGRPESPATSFEAVTASHETPTAIEKIADGDETPRLSESADPLEALIVSPARITEAAVPAPVLPPGLVGCVKAEVIGPSTGVEVLLDGEWKGTAPVLIGQVEPGLHRLTFQSGIVNWDEQVRVCAGDTTVVACVAPDKLLSSSREESTAASPSLNP